MDNVFILVPEITKGMKSIGSKALLSIKNSTSVLEYQINQIRKFHKKCRIFIGTGFESDKIKSLLEKYNNVYFIDNINYDSTNQSKLFPLLFHKFSINNLLVISNGILYRNNPFVFDKNTSQLFVLDKPKNNFAIGCCESEQVNYLFYDLPILWSECVYFNTETIEQIKDITTLKNINQLYLFELINTLIERYHTNFNKTFIKKTNIMKINTLKDIPKAKLFI